MADFKSIGEMMQSCADRAVKIAHDRFGFELDYSEESLKSLETILASVGTDLNLLENEQVEEQVKVWGGYFRRSGASLLEWRVGPDPISGRRGCRADLADLRIAALSPDEGLP